MLWAIQIKVAMITSKHTENLEKPNPMYKYIHNRQLFSPKHQDWIHWSETEALSRLKYFLKVGQNIMSIVDYHCLTLCSWLASHVVLIIPSVFGIRWVLHHLSIVCLFYDVFLSMSLSFQCSSLLLVVPGVLSAFFILIITPVNILCTFCQHLCLRQCLHKDSNSWQLEKTQKDFIIIHRKQDGIFGK